MLIHIELFSHDTNTNAICNAIDVRGNNLRLLARVSSDDRRPSPGGMVHDRCHAANLVPIKRLASFHRAPDSVRRKRYNVFHRKRHPSEAVRHTLKQVGGKPKTTKARGKNNVFSFVASDGCATSP